MTAPKNTKEGGCHNEVPAPINMDQDPSKHLKQQQRAREQKQASDLSSASSRPRAY